MTEVTPHRKTLKDRFFKTASSGAMKGVPIKLTLKWRRLPEFILNRFIGLCGEVTAIVLGIACLWFGTLNSLIAQQSVNISGFKPNAQMWFSEAFNGSHAEIGDMDLKWLSASNTIVFEAMDVVVRDKEGGEIERLKRVQTEIPVQAASKGRFVPKKIVINGGAVTWLRDNGGDVIGGLGTPNTVGKLGPVWQGRQQKQTKRTHFSGVETVSITNATAYIIDDSDGLDITLSDTDLSFVQNNSALEVALTSRLGKDENSVPISVVLKASADLKDYKLNLRSTGLNPSVLSPNRGRYSGMKDFDAPINIDANFEVGGDKGLVVADANIQVGAGRFKFGDFSTRFNAASFVATLSPQSSEMKISNIGITSDNLSFSGSGILSELGAMTDGNINSSPVFDLNFEDVILDRRPTLPAPLKFTRLDMLGRLDLDARQLDFEKLNANFGHYGYDLKARLNQDRTGAWNHISLNGQSYGTLGPNDLLSIWPVQFADGARRWIERSIVKASLKNLKFDANFDEQVFQTAIPDDEDLTLTFDVSGAEVKYISTMTPYVDVSGQGTLLGNSVRFEAEGGTIGNLSLTKAIADIPRLQPKGGDLFITLNGSGSTADMLNLIDQKPFEFPTQFGVNPKDFGGSGEIDMTITRPLLVHFDRERIKYDITGNFIDATAPVEFGSHKIKNGRIKLEANSEGMTLTGPVDIGPWQTHLNWRKNFDLGKTPTRYNVMGRIDRDTLDSLGVGFREYFEGHIDVTINALGDGLNVTSADVTADLTDTAIQIGDYWEKEKGTSGALKGKLKRLTDGGFEFEKMDIHAPGLNLEGKIALADNYKLLEMDLSTAKIDDVIDAAIQMKPDNQDEKLSIFMTGDYLNVSEFVSKALSTNTGGIDVPILLTAGLNSLVLNPSYILQDANVLFSHNGIGITNARLEGHMASGPFKVQMRSFIDGEPRKFDVDIPDASEAVKAFFNLDSIEGGHLEVAAELPAIGKTGALMGRAEIDKFRLVKAPILAQILSIASLTGVVDTFSGGGLSFDTFDVPFSLRDGELSVRKARVSGPALGMTGDGEIRFGDRLVDIDGTLVPAYSANSLLGDVPIIGDIFVGRKGEGIFALSYTVQGDFDKALVAVNPLSALTPGFLRGLFRLKRSELSEDVLAEIKSVAPQN